MKKELPRSRATIRSISELAGVSTSTVSRALNDNPRISAETRDKIHKIAQSSNYAPNIYARSLITRRSGVIALIVGEMTNPFYPEMLGLLTARANERGLHLMLLHLGPGQLDLAMMQTILEYQADGCIVAATRLSKEAEEAFSDFQVPMVMINRPGENRASAVWCNNAAGGAMIGEFLIANGHRRIAYAAGRAEKSDREKGLASALAEHGLKLAARAVGAYTHDSGFKMGMELVAQAASIDAIVAANDIIALGIIDAIRQSDLRIPEDLSVMGFDDIEISGWPSYALTTVSQPTQMMIDRAIDLLMARIADPSLPPEEVFIQGELQLRSSVRLSSTTGEEN